MKINNINTLLKGILVSLIPLISFSVVLGFSEYSLAKNINNYSNDPDTITVYTRNNYLTKNGPSKYLEDLFYDTYKAKIHWISVDNSVNINHDFANRSHVDVIMGMSSSEMNSMVASGNLMRINTTNYPKTTLDKKHYNYKYYFPFESFQLSFIYDKTKITNPPKTLQALITNPAYTIVIEDPTADNIGLDLLYWINDLHKDNTRYLINTLYKHAILETDQNTAYNKFLLGTGDFVLGYSSKPAIEQLTNQTSKYKALTLKNGNLELHNYVAIVANTVKTDLANDFIKMLISQNGQKVITYKHYAYPILSKDINLLAIMTEYQSTPIYINTEQFVRNTPMLKTIWSQNSK